MIISKIDLTIRKYNMLENGDTVAVGVSGGADSMLLLTYLFENREKYGIKVIAANVEHGIRGEESLSDTEFVKSYCEKTGIEFRGISINAPEEAEKAGLGCEEYSRNKRYEFFTSLCTDKIATAHSLTDSIETVLFRLARGTSVKGACGIPPVRGNIIRPLIDCTSAEIREYCSENGIPFVVDSTNSENAYSRNYIRNEILPLFERLNPSYEQAFARFIASANENEDCLNALAEKHGFPLKLGELENERPAVIKRAVQHYANEYGITLDEKHLNSVLALLNKDGRVQLKGNLFAVQSGGMLEIKELADLPEAAFLCESKTVDIDTFNNGNYKKEFAFFCDCDKIVGNVTVRKRQEGDEITLAKRGITKSLKKLFNELKIPENERKRTAVICDGCGIIGIYGYALAERVKLNKNTKKVFMLKISLEDIV